MINWDKVFKRPYPFKFLKGHKSYFVHSWILRLNFNLDNLNDQVKKEFQVMEIQASLIPE